jgi:hypothetical protein
MNDIKGNNMRQFLRVLLILGLSAVMAFTLVSCGETGGGDSVGDGDGGDKGEDDAAVELTSITVTPANPSIALLGTQQFTATGYYSDGTTEDLTTEVIWSSDDISIATTSNTLGTEGLATSKSMGTITVSALHTVTLITNTRDRNAHPFLLHRGDQLRMHHRRLPHLHFRPRRL